MAPSCGCGPGRSPHPGCGCGDGAGRRPAGRLVRIVDSCPAASAAGQESFPWRWGSGPALRRLGGRAAGRSWTGPSGKIDNCQPGVFLAYASEHGQALIDRELYLPTCWIEDEARRADAKIGDEVGFATKQALARAMLARAIEAGVPFRWVTGDEAYGGDPVLRGWPMCWRSPTRTGWGRVAPTPAPWPRSCPPKPGRSAPPATAPAGCASTPGPPGPTGHLRQLGVRGRAVDPPLAHRR
jgi:hypothetical protein